MINALLKSPAFLKAASAEPTAPISETSIVPFGTGFANHFKRAGYTPEQFLAVVDTLSLGRFSKQAGQQPDLLDIPALAIEGNTAKRYLDDVLPHTLHDTSVLALEGASIGAGVGAGVGLLGHLAKKIHNARTGQKEDANTWYGDMLRGAGDLALIGGTAGTAFGCGRGEGMINGAYRFNPTTQGFTLPKLGNLQKQAGWDDIKNFLRPAVDAASAWPVVGGLVKPLAQIAAAPVNAAQQLYHQGKDLVHGVKAVQAINATPGGKEVLQQAAANPQKTVEMAQDAQKTQAWAKENPQLAHWFQTYRDKGFGGALSEGWDDITKPENVRQWAPYAISGLGSLVAAKTMGADNGTALGAALAGGYAGGRLYNGQPLIPQGVKDWGADQWRHATQTQENASGRPNIGTEKTISDNAANAAAQSQNAANAAAQAQ